MIGQVVEAVSATAYSEPTVFPSRALTGDPGARVNPGPAVNVVPPCGVLTYIAMTKLFGDMLMGEADNCVPPVPFPCEIANESWTPPMS